jgi:hypothetical protein
MLGRRGQQRGSVAQQVHDGDTVTTEATGNLGVRFLGLDAPEVSAPLPGTRLPFVDLDDARWEQVLADPFSPELDPMDPPLDGELQQQLAGRVGPGTAANHARLAEAATKALEEAVDVIHRTGDPLTESWGCDATGHGWVLVNDALAGA